MLERPQQPGRLEPHGIAGRLEQLDRGAPDRRLREGGERVGEEDDLAPADLGALLVPADQRVALEARKRPAAVDAGGALEQPSRGEVGERRGGRADPVERADRAEQPRPQRHPVRVLVVAEELRLERRHVDAQRALALARLALEAQVEDLVQPLVAEGLLRVGFRERLDERVRAPAGGVLLLARGHVRRAHDADAGLAAGADPLAAVGRRAHAVGEVQVGLDRAGRRQRRVAQALGERRSLDHHARVEAVVRVEQRLDLAERVVELVAEDPPVERAAHAAVAVLGRVDAVEGGDEVDDLLGDRAHGLDPAGLGEVDERADVQAADRAVAVPAGVQAVAVEDLLEGGHVVVQPLGRDRRVLDERERPAGAAAGGHQQPQPRLADLGERLLLVRRSRRAACGSRGRGCSMRARACRA